jgi:hypothetical protein
MPVGRRRAQAIATGNRTGRVRSAEGAIEYSAPQIADRSEPFRSRLRGLVGGRPRLLSAEELEAETKLLANGTPPKDVASVLGVSIPTLYRHCPASQRTTSAEAA